MAAALKLAVDSLDGMDEATKAFYVEDNGKFKLAVDGLEDTSGLKSALQKERRDRAELEKKVKRWDALGKSDDEISELLKRHEETQQTEAERKGEWDKLRAQMNEKHAAEIKARDEKLTAKDKAVAKYLIDSAATAAIAEAQGNARLLLPHVQQHVRVVEEGGEFIVRVVDAKGDPRVNAKGEHLTISELVAEMRQSEDFGAAFKGAGHSGGGTPPGNSNGGTPTNIKRRSDLKTRADRVAFVDKHGDKAYFALPL
jgi:hypothetical protein